jgi:hypothetical protein
MVINDYVTIKFRGFVKKQAASRRTHLRTDIEWMDDADLVLTFIDWERMS